MFGVPPQNPNNIFWHSPLQTPPSQISKNTFSGPWCAEVCAFGAPPQNPNNIFWHRPLQTQHSHPRYPKTPFLAHGVQRCGCLRGHPGSQTIFFGGHWGLFGPGPPFMAGLQLSTSPPERDPRTHANCHTKLGTPLDITHHHDCPYCSAGMA